MEAQQVEDHKQIHNVYCRSQDSVPFSNEKSAETRPAFGQKTSCQWSRGMDASVGGEGHGFDSRLASDLFVAEHGHPTQSLVGPGASGCF